MKYYGNLSIIDLIKPLWHLIVPVLSCLTSPLICPGLFRIAGKRLVWSLHILTDCQMSTIPEFTSLILKGFHVDRLNRRVAMSVIKSGHNKDSPRWLHLVARSHIHYYYLHQIRAADCNLWICFKMFGYELSGSIDRVGVNYVICTISFKLFLTGSWQYWDI